jgi:drug/metabolite transporter (DMT)-like permease
MDRRHVRSDTARNGPAKPGPFPDVTRSSALAFKTYATIAVMLILGPTGNVLLSAGMKRVAAPTEWAAASLASVVAGVVSSGAIWLGLACLVGYVTAEMMVLSWADYSYVQPASAASYPVVALLGYAVLGEDVSLTGWLGVAMICLGVLVVGRTRPRTTEAAPS